MLVISAGLHVAGLAVFQIHQSRAQGHTERGARAYFLASGSAEAARLAPLLAAADPALFSPAQPSTRDVWKLPETTYVASFDTSQPALLTAPLAPLDLPQPPVSTTGPVSQNFAAISRSRKTEPGASTAVTFGQELDGRTALPPENVSFSVILPDGLKSLAPAEFLIAVSPDGRPLYFFLRKSSGSEALDRAALQYLTALRFSARDEPEPAWSSATFHWGADVLLRPQP